MPPEKEPLDKTAERLKAHFDLTDFALDSECIYQPGDLSALLRTALSRLLPEHAVDVTETISADGQQYVATVSSNGRAVGTVYADTHADFLPDDFLTLFEELPEKLGTEKRFYQINPLLLGQELWYFCGLPRNIDQAKAAGLPVVLPGEDWMSGM